jgi:hypothetical protein
VPLLRRTSGRKVILMRTLLAATLSVLLLASSALAQEARQQEEDAAKRTPGATLDSDAQGTRPGTATDTPTSTPNLQQALQRFWNSPVDLQGNPIQGVGALAVWQDRGNACTPPPGQPCPASNLMERPMAASE